MRNLFIFIVVNLSIIGVGFIVYQYIRQIEPIENEITTFEECASAGNEIMESHPPQCKTADGNVFTAELETASEYGDEIVVRDPLSYQLITSPATISGEARGTWFFEANMPASIVDANGEVLGTIGIFAEGEWMTEQFVPFSGRIEFITPTTDTGKLIIARDNPSGLPEHDKQIEIPVRFE